MITQKNDYLILKYFILISIVVALLQYALKHVITIVQRKFSGETELSWDESSFNPDSSVEEDISVQLRELKRLAQKISDEKRFLESYPLDSFINDFQSELNQKCILFREQIRNDLEIERFKNLERYKEAEKALGILKKDITDLKSAFMILVKAIQPIKDAKKTQKYDKNLVENSAQTEGEYDIIPNGETDFKLPDNVLLSLKECMMKVTTESEKAWVASVRSSLKTLEDNYTDVKSLLVSNWEDVYNEFLDSNSILDQVQNIEQTMFCIRTFLQQQSNDAQIVRDNLVFFNHKFQKSMLRSETRWIKSCSNLEILIDKVRQAQEIMKNSSANFSGKSVTVIQHFTNLEGLMKEFVCVTELTHHTEAMSRILKDSVCTLTGDISNLRTKIDSDYCRKLNELSEALQSPRDKLYILYKTTEDLYALREIAKQAPLNPAPSVKQSAITLPISELDETKLQNYDIISDYSASNQEVSKEAEDLERNQKKPSDQEQIPNDSSHVEEIKKIQKYHSNESFQKNFPIIRSPEKSNMKQSSEESIDYITKAMRDEITSRFLPEDSSESIAFNGN